ncbi:MAG: hypothetical protein Q8R16_01285 [bacterium]|nr:hypothetical protein [bacterium]
MRQPTHLAIAILLAALHLGGCRTTNAPAQSLAERANEHYWSRQQWCTDIGAKHYRNGMCYRRQPDGALEWLNLAVGVWDTCDPKGPTPEWCERIITGGWNPQD